MHMGIIWGLNNGLVLVLPALALASGDYGRDIMSYDMELDVGSLSCLLEVR